MSLPSSFIDLDLAHSSYVVLISLSSLALTAGVLFRLGVVGWALQVLGFVMRTSIRQGFLLWERLLAWASWPLFLTVVLGFLILGGLTGDRIPGARFVGGLVPLFMGATACLAYMFIDLERYEVERGYKAVHNPLKGQELAIHLARYGQQVRVPLLIAATVGMVGGFALLEQGLYETIGTAWFKAEGGHGGPTYVDFLASTLIHLLGIVDVLNLAQSRHFLRSTHVQPIQWPASLLVAGFKAFFTLVLLQQIFASLRQGKLLAETITDFWSPHEPIHERARSALPQYGVLAIRPLLLSLRQTAALTKEQRDQLPLILATIGPSTIPTLVHHLHDPHEHVRAICVAALGQLHAVDTVHLLVELGKDPSPMVRQSLVEALGVLGSTGTRPGPRKRGLGQRRVIGWLFRWKKRRTQAPLLDPVELAVTALESALADDSAAVRTQAALALGRIGAPAAKVAPGLINLLKDADETVRCQAAEALGQVGGETGPTVAALASLLEDASSPVKAAAARALGALETAASPAIPSLVPLLQDRDESVRQAAAEAIARTGTLTGAATEALVEGLASRDDVVRAQTAEALGTIGEAAEGATPALVEALENGNDRVRGKAVEALGKIGESAAPAAVPGLVRALRDQDNWVSALAAEALGQMGESADGAIPALVRSLGHINPQVRGNAAEALGKMSAAAVGARTALERASQDEDGGVRGQAIRALGAIGCSTPSSEKIVLAGLQDPDPLVRTAAVEALGQWGKPGEAAVSGLLPLLEDANDQVKVEAIQVLPKLAGATPTVLDGLCRRLLEDDSVQVQIQAALALGRLGAAATSAGGALLRAVQTGEVSVRDQAMRAIAVIQPAETLEAFTVGLQDANGDIRKVASGGWMNAELIPEEVIPALVEALRDPEIQVRANAARALARLDPLPTEAIPLLIGCAADPSDGLRMTAVMALRGAPPAESREVMEHLLEDANVRIRLVAASSLLSSVPDHSRAGGVLVEALRDTAPRVRKAALAVVESLGVAGTAFLEDLKTRTGLEEEVELRETLTRLVEQLANQAVAPKEVIS